MPHEDIRPCNKTEGQTVEVLSALRFKERAVFQRWKGCVQMKEVIVKLEYGMEVGYGKEIVRCRDCKHYHKGFNCDLLQKPILKGDDWFCADGERKEVK